MNRQMYSSILIAGIAMLTANVSYAEEPVKVTVFNFVRAESDMKFKQYGEYGAFAKMFHIRQPVPMDKQDVIRMNRDTLYSAGVFDLTTPVTISKPDPAGRFQSMLIINQDHSMHLPVEYGAGEFTLTKEKVGTRYVMVVIRTFMNSESAEDVKAANALQDRVVPKQAKPGSFEFPNWDAKSLLKIRQTLDVLSADMPNFSGSFGDRKQLDPIKYLLGCASGWGGNPREAAIYVNVFPEQNDGSTPHKLTVSEVPVDGFWSITLYNSDGYMEKNALDAYSVNNVTGKKNSDGSTTIHFGGNPENVNYLPIMKGWNYLVRLYRPRKEILDGTWKFPSPVATK